VLDAHDSLQKIQKALFFLSDKNPLSFSEISGDDLLPLRVYLIGGAQVFVRPDFDKHEQLKAKCYLNFQYNWTFY